MRWTKDIRIIALFGMVGLFACDNPKEENGSPSPTLPQVFTPYSELANAYEGFDSPKAINRLAAMDNEYFNSYAAGGSRYYGTEWRKVADSIPHADSASMFGHYKGALGHHPDSMHCTLYAYEGLRAGLPDSLFHILTEEHRRIWKDREIAGWSIARILTQRLGWKAYLVLDRTSQEFEQCRQAYERKGVYPVWRQPDIPLEAMFIRGEQDSLIQSLLLENEFGWGFSWQGWHTWVTRFDTLKECNWLGAPASGYDLGYGSDLFIETPFLQYYDYASHIVVFPKKEDDSK